MHASVAVNDSIFRFDYSVDIHALPCVVMLQEYSQVLRSRGICNTIMRCLILNVSANTIMFPVFQ